MSPRHPVDQAAEPTEADTAPASPSRRRFVRNVGLGAAALGAVAVTGTTLAGVASAQTEEPPELGAGDVALLQFLQSLSLAGEEGMASAAEKAFLASPTAEELREFSRHHAAQAAAITTLLPEAEVITAPNPTMLGELDGAVAGAADETALLNVLYEFEENLAATMLAAMAEAESFLVAGAVAKILPVVGQQAAAIGTLNDLPVTDWLPTFGSTDGAFTQAAYPTR